MRTDTIKSSIRRAFDYTAIVGFCSALALPLAGRILNLTPSFDPELEKRAAAMPPKLEVHRWGPIAWPRKRMLAEFPLRFEAYFNDRYGFRRNLLDLYTQARIAGVIPRGLDKPGGAGSTCQSVLIGLNGWLYLDGDCITNYRATRPFAADELDAWSAQQRRIRDWLRGRSCRYVFFVAPDKPSIYPEFLPAVANRVGEQTRLDQLSNRLRTELDRDYLDLRGPLRTAKSKGDVYYQTDSHWNAYGAWVGYDELMRAIGNSFPRLQAALLSDFDRIEGRTRGDLETLLPSSNWPENAGVELKPKHARKAVIAVAAISPSAGVYDDGYRTVNPAPAEGRAVVVHDSFMLTMLPFLGEHWKEVIYVHNRHGFPAELIERERPDLVVYEIAERRLLKPPPAEPPLKQSPIVAEHDMLRR